MEWRSLLEERDKGGEEEEKIETRSSKMMFMPSRMEGEDEEAANTTRKKTMQWGRVGGG